MLELKIFNKKKTESLLSPLFLPVKRSYRHPKRGQLPISQNRRPQDETYIAGAWILDFLASGTVRNKFLSFTSCPPHNYRNS